MTYMILAKDVVTFGSFNTIDSDGHENDKKSVRLAKQLTRKSVRKLSNFDF